MLMDVFAFVDAVFATRAAVRGGRVVEQGTHGELRAKPGGFYAGLVARQETSPNDDRNPSKGSTAEQGGAIEATPFNGRRKPKAMRESVLQRSSVRLSIIPADLLAKLGAGKVRLFHHGSRATALTLEAQKASCMALVLLWR